MHDMPRDSQMKRDIWTGTMLGCNTHGIKYVKYTIRIEAVHVINGSTKCIEYSHLLFSYKHLIIPCSGSQGCGRVCT